MIWVCRRVFSKTLRQCLMQNASTNLTIFGKEELDFCDYSIVFSLRGRSTRGNLVTWKSCKLYIGIIGNKLIVCCMVSTWALTSCCLLCTRPQGGSPTAITFFWETAGAAALWSLTASPTQRDTPSLRPPVRIQAPEPGEWSGTHRVRFSIT